jgi:hypothetical protein
MGGDVLFDCDFSSPASDARSDAPSAVTRVI